VAPVWRGQGLGTALLRWSEARIRALAAAEHPGERWEFAGNASSTEADATSLLLHEGYTAPYHVLSLMLDPGVPVPEALLPPGITVRLVLPEHLAPIAAGIGEAYEQQPVVEGAVKGRYDEAYDPSAYAADLATPRYDPTLWQVAWEDDELVGQVLTRVQGAVAEVFEMSVRPAWRRRGLARALLVRSVVALRARGIDEIRVHTVQEFLTRAADVYRAVGFRVVKVFSRYRKANELPSSPNL
jgi:GNAT superfamily N-acetyltransferase